MTPTLLLAMALAASASDTGDASSPVLVTNFKSGLACTRSRPGGTEWEGWICQPTELILVTDQGDCVYDGKDKQCTWIGFEFDYVAGVKGRKLQCHRHSTIPADEGNFKGVRTRGETDADFELELPEASGRFYNPQYWVMAMDPPGSEDTVATTRCSSEGKQVFEFVYRVRFPVDPIEHPDPAKKPG